MGIKTQFTGYLNYKTNNQKAINLLNREWEKLNDNEKQTWYHNNSFVNNIFGQELDKDGYYTFMSYFMKIFGTNHNSNNTVFNSITLSDGSSKGYTDRTSRIFTVR